MKNKKIFWKILLLLSMIACTGATIYIVLYFFSGTHEVNYLTGWGTSVTSTDQAADGKKLAENHNINWEQMQKDNSDLYAWLYVPNTDVNYVVAQSAEDEPDDFYLDHNTQKEYEFAGTIYSEKQNAKDFSDPVTILYGHNMLNGSMFATLHKFENATFFKKNKYMYIYTPGHKRTYKIYAAYVYDDRHILNSFDFSDKKILKKYLKYTQDPDSMTKNTRKVTLDTDSKILTLSTCTSGAEDTRYIVQGVLVKDEKTK